MSPLSIAAQLYTVRDQTAADFTSTIGRLTAIGYRTFELAGYGNLSSADTVKKSLDSFGASICSTHISLESFEQNPDLAWRDGEKLACKVMVIPYVSPSRRQTKDDWLRLADLFNRLGGECARRGFELAYHNHAFEFEPVDGGGSAFELLWRKTDPKLVKAELDVYWVAFASADPIDWMNRLADRLWLLHLKDLAPTPDRRFAELGRGTLDFPAICQTASQLGVRWGIVEQDETYGESPVECLKTSLGYLKSIGLG